MPNYMYSYVSFSTIDNSYQSCHSCVPTFVPTIDMFHTCVPTVPTFYMFSNISYVLYSYLRYYSYTLWLYCMGKQVDLDLMCKLQYKLSRSHCTHTYRL